MAYYTTYPGYSSFSPLYTTPLFHLLDDSMEDDTTTPYSFHQPQIHHQQLQPQSHPQHQPQQQHQPSARPVYPLRRVNPSTATNATTATPTTTTTTTTPTTPSTFTPRFNIRETSTAYLLSGDLPGVQRRDLEVEFTDARTVRVSGVVREDEWAGEDEMDVDEKEKKEEKEEKGEESDDDAKSVRSTSSYQATVEDADDEDDMGVVAKKEEKKKEEKKEEVSVQKKEKIAAPTKQVKYHTRERPTGRFQRTFTFASRVDQDGVRARLRDGVLRVVVPKERERMGGRRVVVLGE